MSYRSRLYNHRNAQSMEAVNDKPFFPKQHGPNKMSNKGSFFQAKLAVNEPGDQYEQEADNVANSVVSNKTATPVLQHKKISSIQRLATTAEEEKISTNDQRMDRDKEKPFQTANAEPEKEKKGIQRMADPMMEKDKMKGVQKMGDPMMEKDKMKGIQKMGDSMMEKDKMKGMQKMSDPMMEKDKMKGVQKMGDPMMEEEKMKKGTSVQTKHEATSSTASPQVSSKIEHTAGKGNALPPKAMHEMNSFFGFDFSNVRLHNDSEAVTMNKELQAQAFTHGTDIYFNEGKFDPGSAQGKFLLAHELTHVVQQNGEEIKRDTIQRDLAESLPLKQGIFEIDMHANNGATATPATTQAGLDGSIKFTASTDAPYSNEIKLIQIVRDRDTAGANVDPASLPVGRGSSLRTTEDTTTGAEGGFFTDVLHQNFTAAGPGAVAEPGSAKGLAYEGGTPVFGFKRSNDPADIKAAEITDTPGSSGDRNFDLETVAKGQDTNTVYGSIHWSFGTKKGNVVNETVRAEDAQSATFNSTVELHRNFYVHEPVVFYFEFDSDALSADEAGKIDLFLDYLKRFPDVRRSLGVFADKKGNADYNASLSLNRADNVKKALKSKGIDESRIDDLIIGFGSTEQFTSGDLAPNAGQSQDLEANRRGNRRVVLTFEHTASVSGP